MKPLTHKELQQGNHLGTVSRKTTGFGGKTQLLARAKPRP